MKKIYFYATVMLFFGVLLSSQAQSRRALPFSWDNASVYFMLTDRFNNGNFENDFSYGRQRTSVNSELDFQGGDIAGVTQKINSGYFDDLGVSAIWITAPYEQMHGPTGPDKHWAYHGYFTKDWSQFDDNMTTEDEFRAFVDAAHDHGIRVVMDIVINHTGYADTGWDDSWGDAWVRQDGSGEIYGSLAGLPDVRTDNTSVHTDLPYWILSKWDAAGVKNKELSELDAFFNRTGYPRTPRYYIIKWLTDWVREYGIDGFRVDTAKHVEVEVWKELKEQATIALAEWKAANPAKKPDDLPFWMTGEVYGQSVYSGKNYYYENGFDNVINFAFIGDVDKSAENLFSDYAQRINSDDGFNVLNYIASHDVGPYNRNNLFHAGTQLLLAPGCAQIYYGDESGRNYFQAQTYHEQGYRSFMNWYDIENNSSTKTLLSHWQKLGTFRREHVSIGGGTHQKLSDSPYIFRREYNKGGISDKTLVAMNVPENSNPYTLNVYGTFSDGTLLKDYFSGSTATVSNGQATFQTSFGMLLVGIPFDADAESVILNIDPQSGHSVDPFNVTMSAITTADNASTTIYYTLDGTEPSKSSAVYNSPIVIDANTTVKAIAYDSENNSSGTVSRNYTIGEITGLQVFFKNTSNWGSVNVHYWNELPDVLPASTWPGPTMTHEGDGWYSYTFEGVTSTNLLFSNNSASKTADMSRDKNGWYDNGIWYDIDPRVPVDNPPTLSISPASGTFTLGESVIVTLSATDDKDVPVIYYTTDGSTPSASSTEYSSDLEINSTTTVKAIAYDSKNQASGVASATYTFREPIQGLKVYMKNVANWPSVNVHYWNELPDVLPASTWPGPTMSSEGDGWYSYTFDGVSSTNLLFSNNAASKTADMFRDKNGWYDNGTWYDTDPRAPKVPVLSVDKAGTSFTSSIKVTLSATEAGLIYYTLDGSTPTESSTAYSGSLTFTETTTLKAKAFNTVGESNLISETYTKQDAPAGLTLHCKKPDSWSSVYIYFWNTTGASLTTGWPGQQMTDDGNGWYSYTLVGVECANIIFNNNGSPQTGDLTGVCEESWYDNGWVSNPSAKAGTVSVSDLPEQVAPYPNPFSSEINIAVAEKNTDIAIKILDLKGQIHYAISTNSGNGNVKIQPELGKGIYIMQVSNASIINTYKVVKQ